MKKIQIVLAVITGLIVLASCLGLFGYFGANKMRESRLRTEARAAFDAKDWKRAEKLLKAYVSDHIYSEADFVRLAEVYRHFGNTEEEMRCWGRASVLNPRNREYWDKYLACALNARAFPHLYTTLAYKLNLNETLDPREQMLFFYCQLVMRRGKDVEQLYEFMVNDDPDVFHRDDLGRLAEFLMTCGELTTEDRMTFLKHSIDSNDPFVRLESILYYLNELEPSDAEATEGANEAGDKAAEGDDDGGANEAGDKAAEGDDDEGANKAARPVSFFERKEAILKQVVDMNRFVGIPILAEFYFEQLQFASVIELAEPYLADIDDARLSIIYAESCVFDSHPEKLKPLADHFRTFGRKYRAQIIYFEALYDFCQGLEGNADLAKRMHDLGAEIRTDLSNLIHLQLALNNDNIEKVRSSLETIMWRRPFYDLQERARTSVRHYLWSKIEADPALADDSRMARLAQLVSTPGVKDSFLMRLILSDLNRRNVITRQIIEDDLRDFPYDPYLLRIAAEFELFNDNPDLCLEYTERYYALPDAERSTTFDLLHMLAQELSGNIEEATKEFTALVDNSEMDRGLLYRYFKFCIQHKRKSELGNMAQRLAVSSVPDLKALAPFFRAEVLFLDGKPDEAISLLETVETDSPDFALHAADMFHAHGRLDRALSGCLALLDTYPDRQLILTDVAEIYLDMEMKAEALSYADRAWETDMDDAHSQYVYAKVLAANRRYQEAERVLRIPYREVKLEPEIAALWKDIMIHCIQEDFENRLYLHALDRANHYLIIYPDDYEFLEYKTRAEEEFRQEEAWRFLDDDWSVPSSTQDDADGDLSSAF